MFVVVLYLLLFLIEYNNNINNIIYPDCSLDFTQTKDIFVSFIVVNMVAILFYVLFSVVLIIGLFDSRIFDGSGVLLYFICLVIVFCHSVFYTTIFYISALSSGDIFLLASFLNVQPFILSHDFCISYIVDKTCCVQNSIPPIPPHFDVLNYALQCIAYLNFAYYMFYSDYVDVYKKYEYSKNKV